MATADGTVLGTTQIIDNGRRDWRWNLVFLGDGYRQNELLKYQADVTSVCDTLLTSKPFDDLRTAFNIFRVDIVSTDSGADDPAACGGTGSQPRTFLDAAFCTNGIRRLLVANTNLALSTAGAQVPEWHSIFVVVNSAVYGGSGGAMAVFSTAQSATEIALHELGHTAFQLADEYEYYQGCGVDTDRDQHPAGEPASPNVTTKPARAQLKWASLVAASTALPTTRNADCRFCDPQPNPLPAATVGAYEGAHYYHCGAYRPQFDCRMRALGHPFCAVCQRQIRKVLTPFLPAKVPDVRELLHGVAGQLVIAAGLVPKFVGSTSNPQAWVFTQSPAAGSDVRRGSTVTMNLKVGPIP